MRQIKRLRQVASAHAGHLAVVDAGEQLSYSQLLARVEGEAWSHLLPGTRVAMKLPRGSAFVVRLLALWSHGLVPLPLDPDLPEQRRAEIESLAQAPAEEEGAPAYAIATSGSGGKPKVVEVLADGLLPMLEAQVEAFDLKSGDRALWMLSPGFDASLSDVLTALLAGATLVCGPEDVALRLPEILSEFNITHVDLPPALLDVYGPEQMPQSLRVVVVGGAPSSPEMLRRWAGRFRVVSVYGPTEATICSSLSVVDQQWDAPYLGQPIAGLRYRVVDNELCIGGPGVARGYAGDTQASAFWKEDGRRWYRTGDLVRESSSPHGLSFAGRADRQLKWKGQRIEPEEIEARLRPVLGGGVAVVAHPGGLAVIWEGPDRRELAEAVLREALPGAWLPRHWQRVESLPRLANGKVDLLSLSTWEIAMKPPAVDQQEDSLERIARAAELERAGLQGVARHQLTGGSAPMAASLLEEIAQQLMLDAPASRARPGRPNRLPGGHRSTILVTGASGRLGAAVLPKLLAHGDVLALGHDRVLPTGAWEVLVGDMTLPRLGLCEEAWSSLRSRVTAVLHLAAKVDMSLPLDELLEANARPLLTLAQLEIPIYLASSLSVLLSASPVPSVLDGVSHPQTVLGAYSQSKWVAERLWEKLGSGGKAFRYGLLLGQARADDLLALVVRGLVELGCYPIEAIELAFDVTPLDYAVEQTLHHVFAAPGGESVVTISSGMKVSFGELIEELAQLGYPLAATSLKTFFALPAPGACAIAARLALESQRADGGIPEWNLFLMSQTDWPPEQAGMAKACVMAALRRYLASALTF